MLVRDRSEHFWRVSKISEAATVSSTWKNDIRNADIVDDREISRTAVMIPAVGPKLQNHLAQ